MAMQYIMYFRFCGWTESAKMFFPALHVAAPVGRQTVLPDGVCQVMALAAKSAISNCVCCVLYF